MNTRPTLTNSTTPKDFQDFYWLKEELSTFCRQEGLKVGGSKIELASRITHYLRTGERNSTTPKSTPKPSSKFDWRTEQLSLTTKITDNYTNTENVRLFFEQAIGKSFKFNVKFMNWMKTNKGKTLSDAVAAWQIIKQAAKDQTRPKEIAPQFEYNRYLRDFLQDNPNKDRKMGIELWKIKKAKRGDNVYRRTDLKWLEE